MDIVNRKEKKSKIKGSKLPEDKLELFRKLTCDLYVTCNNMVLSHDLFRRATLGAEYSELASPNANASAFFTRPENANYIAARRIEVAKSGFEDFCKIKNIEHKDFAETSKKELFRNVSKSPAEVREETLVDLQRIIDNPPDDQTLLAAIKQRTEITDAKYKDKGQDLSETEKLIHFYLPSDLCDNCHNRCLIEDQYKDLPEIDLNLEEYD